MHTCCQTVPRVVRVDTEPMLRSICRSERARTQAERNGRRFYHYLRNTALGTGGQGHSFGAAETFDRYCEIFAEAATTTAAAGQRAEEDGGDEE